MKQEDLFKKIGLILNELNVQYEYLAQHPQQLNELELALFHANADFLSDHAQILKKITSTDVPLEIQSPIKSNELANNDDNIEQFENDDHGNVIQEIHQVEEVTFAEETPEIEEEIFKLDQSPSTFEFILNESSEGSDLIDDEKFEFEEKSVDELFNRPLSQEEENILAQKRKLSETVVEIPADIDEDEIGPEPFLVSKVVEKELEDEVVFPIQEADMTFKEAVEPVVNTQTTAIEDPGFKPTLNDLLASKAERSVNHQNGASAISDLKQGINLNDKLVYIKDLFNGYNLAYAEAIEIANKLPNFEAADNFFKKNYAIKYNWAERQATVDKFYALLNQRFK